MKQNTSNRATSYLSFIGIALAVASPAQLAWASDPGTGDADWVVVHSGGTLYVHAEINDGVAEELDRTGTEPPLSSLPILVYNSDGEPLRIRNIGGHRVYSGTFDIVVEPGSGCTHCMCDIFDPWCNEVPTSDTNCTAEGDTCIESGCHPGGNGDISLDADFTSGY